MTTNASSNMTCSSNVSHESIQKSANDDSAEDSDSSIDAAVDGTIDQRKDGPSECFCSRPTYVREVQKRMLRKEM